jgi:DNA-binding winged helix-turn-helix (wHTH) protein/tetratricopeptide (TPR) repeat protein
MSNPVYRFDSFRLDAAARELVSGGERIVLPSSAFDCLAYLVEHRDRAVGRDELISAIWGRSDVTDTQLGQAIVRVRSALGDTGREQRTVRTVPRFGYRFVAAAMIEEGEADASAPRIEDAASAAEPATDHAAPDPGESSAVQSEMTLLSAPALRARSWRAVGIATAVVVGVVAMILMDLRFFAERPAQVDAPPIEAARVSRPASEAVPAIVWPASVTAPGDWAWLRLGIMDLVSNRLRSGKVPTVPSDNVVGMVRAQSERVGLSLVAPDALSIEPQVERDGSLWNVRLHARGAGQDLIAAASSTDVLSAARNATDSLLIRLGHVPPTTDEPHEHALDELVQRANAASLAGQIQLAANLIEQAPAELRANPEVGFILANVELRAGRYGASEKRLEMLLAREDSPRNPVLRGRLLNTLAAIHVRRDDGDAARKAYEEAEKLLKGRDGRALGLTYLGLGLAAAMQGDVEAAGVRFGQTRVEMEGAGNLLGVAQVDVNLAALDLLAHRPADALRRLLDVETRFAQFAAQEELTFTRITIADAYLQLLDVSQARVAIDRCWPVEEHVANERMRWQVVAMRAQVLAAEGHLGEADALLARLQQEADPIEDVATRAIGMALAARIAAWRGLDDEAAKLAQAAMTPALENYVSDPRLYVLTWLTRLRALRRSGAVDEAAIETQHYVDWLERNPDEWRLAWADLARAEQSSGEGRRDDAIPQFNAAFGRIQRFAIPEDTVAISQPFILALIDSGDAARASTISGSVAIWADRDFRVAWAQARLYRALDKPVAARQSTERALQLAGERALPGERRAAITPGRS